MTAPALLALLEAARAYREQGWELTPLQGKRPYLRGWLTRRLSPSELERELRRPGRGVGVLLGALSGGLVDVDLDAEAALDAAPALLPFTCMVHGRPGRRWSHYGYRAPGAVSQAFRGPSGMLVELRAEGAQTCLPPSPHPSGERLHWESAGTPARADPTALTRAVGRLAVATYLGTLGWPLPAAVHFVQAPARHTLRRLAEHPRCPPLASWLGLAHEAPLSAAPSPPPGAKASPYTRAILARIDVVGAARLLGLVLHDHRQQRCPFHDDRRASLQVTGALWRCHAGCGAGTAIHLVALTLGMTYREARNWLARELDLDWRTCLPPSAHARP